MIPGLRAALDAVDARGRAEPDLPARDWRFEDEEEAELHGDASYYAEDLDEL